MLGKMTLVKTIIISGSMVERSSSLLLDLRYVGSIHVADEMVGLLNYWATVLQKFVEKQK